MSVVVVDWLGRGGIAQTTPAWVDALERAGHQTVVVTRRGRELRGDHVRTPSESAHPLLTHLQVARLAARTIREMRPDLVVVQNYVLPPLETALDRAIAATGSRSVAVIHDHRLHSKLAGSRAGLRHRLRQADVVVTHSHFVADAVARFCGRDDVITVPLPLPTEAVDGSRASSCLPPSDESTALMFGVVKRRYKGVDVVCELAAGGVAGWRFAAAGVGAPTDAPGVIGVPGFLETSDLVATVASAQAAVLPYRIASQSAAVVLGQALGAVPIATAVGGIPEQIDSEVDGVLIPPGASLDRWRDALEYVRGEGDRLARAAGERVHHNDAVFRERICVLV